eukprot:12479783-Prorocentrum_lima.AAC.1
MAQQMRQEHLLEPPGWMCQSVGWRRLACFSDRAGVRVLWASGSMASSGGSMSNAIDSSSEGVAGAPSTFFVFLGGP